MAKFDWKNLVQNVAPMIGTALGGPIAGMATKAISVALFGEGETSTGSELEKKIAMAIQGDPDALLKIKEADNAFEFKMRELDIDVEKVNAADRQGARSLAKETSLMPQIVLATVYNSGFILIIYAVFFSTLELIGVQKDIALYLLGILSAGLVQINNFFFGSSSGSKEKTAKLVGR